MAYVLIFVCRIDYYAMDRISQLPGVPENFNSTLQNGMSYVMIF